MQQFTETFPGFLIFLLLGLVSLLRGIWMLNGGGKAWYFARHLYAGFTYAQIPAGIAMLWFAFAAILPPSLLNIAMFFGYVGIAIGLLAVLFNFLRPSFLKPAWLKRLERQHRDIMPILDKEANEMGLETWEKYVDNRGLDVWVAEVRRKNGLPEKPTPAEQSLQSTP